MGNIRGWGGALPRSWHQRSLVLQKQILARMRELGIIPVLPAFAGHVPKAFKRFITSSRFVFNFISCINFKYENTHFV